jgi:hypothetical protein
MVKICFFLPFWGLFHVPSHHTLADCRHAVISSSLPLSEFSFSISTLVDLSSPDLMSRLDRPRNGMPLYHPLARSHYQRFETSQFSQHFSYADFCLFEEALADIVWSYLHDTTRDHSYILRVNPFFLYGDSIKSYMDETTLQHSCWITPTYDMGGDYVVTKIQETNVL